MNITFLLGNGFDIGLKMPTRYEDFYEEYCKISADDNDNIKKFKKMLQERNKDEVKKIIDWADFEKAFGEHSKDPEITSKREYLERFEHFVETFNAYLENVEACVDYSDTDAIAKTMDTAVKTFHHIRTADKNSINSFINQFGSDRAYNFVTFNYTRTADNCVDAFRQIIKTDRTRRIGSITHIHGFIDQNMIVGVNDENQILNDKFSSDPEVVRELVKPQQNANSRTAYEEAMISAINGSHIICTYGMSIGETDKKWWNKISSWLLGDSRRILVILVHERKYNPRFPHQQDRLIRPILEKFLSFSSLSDADKKKIENRIFVGVNNDVFAMNLYHAKPKTHPSVKKIDPNMIFAGDVPPEESGLPHKEGQVYLQRVNVLEASKPDINQAALDAIDEYNASLPTATVV